MMKQSIISFLLLLVLLVGCIESDEIEKLGLINARGLDVGDDDSLETTLVIFQFSSQSEEATKVVTGQGKTLEGATEDAEDESAFKIAPGKNKLTLYGREMAEKGIISLMDTESRDARVSDLMYLSVSDTTAQEILSVEEKEISMDIGQFLYELIDNHSRDHNVPRKTLQDFLRVYHDIGQDNVLPLFKLHDGIPRLAAIALFRGDRLVGELTRKEGTLINLMDRTVKEQVLELSLPLAPFKGYLEGRVSRENKKAFDVTFLIKKGNSRTKLIDKDNLVFQTETDMELRLLEENAGVVLEDTQIIKQIEREVEKNMEHHFEKLLTKLQDLGADPFGYGRYYKASIAGQDMTRKEWREKFPEIDVKFKVNAKIIKHGVTD